MVRKSVLALSLLMAAQYALAERPVFDARSLQQQMEGNATDNRRASERLRASRGDTRSLRVLNEDDIIYKLPNGVLVKGMLLPNGRVAPAIDTDGQKRPACVTKDYRLVPGRFDPIGQVIACNLQPEEMAIVDDGMAPQASEAAIAAALSPKKETQQGVDHSKKYNRTPAAEQETPAQSSPPPRSQQRSPRPASPPPRQARPGEYVPPARNSQARNTSVGGVIRRDANNFGISTGTWVTARLVRTVSSAEGGRIEFVTTEDIEGRYQVLPAGTTLFANHRINEALRRLEGVTVMARLPDGREVPNVNFQIHSLDQTAGLSGRYVRDRGGELANTGTNALLSLAGDVAVSASNDMTSGTVGSVRDDVVRTEQRHVERKPNAIIEVSPQRVLLQSVKSF